jgi:hypothetical protein
VIDGKLRNWCSGRKNKNKNKIKCISRFTYDLKKLLNVVSSSSTCAIQIGSDQKFMFRILATNSNFLLVLNRIDEYQEYLGIVKICKIFIAKKWLES